MKKTILVTLVTALMMVGIFYAVDRLSSVNDGRTVKVGFIYVGDGATAYTRNFMDAQDSVAETYGDRVVCDARYNVAEGKEAKYIQELIDDGCDIIFGTSYGYGEAMKSAAEANPTVQFCQATCANANEEPVLSNFHTYMGHIYEGRYVAGVVAGLKLRELIDEGEITADEALIGYVAAYPFAEVISGYTAFFLGVRSECPEAVMKVKYTNSWSSYTLEEEYAEELIAEGCVIISQHSDTKGPANACENADTDHPVYIVSYNQSMIDVAPTTALTGCRIDWAPYEIAAVGAVLEGRGIESVFSGDFTVNGQDVGAGFSEGWVTMLDLNSVLAPEGTDTVIEETISKLEKGKITVFEGDYTGTDPYDSSDTIDLSGGFSENTDSSAPQFHYVLDGVITVEE